MSDQETVFRPQTGDYSSTIFDSEFVMWRTRRRGANPLAYVGLIFKGLKMPDLRHYAVEAPKPGTMVAEPTGGLGCLLRDVMKIKVVLGSIATIRNI